MREGGTGLGRCGQRVPSGRQTSQRMHSTVAAVNNGVFFKLVREQISRALVQKEYEWGE